MNKRAGLLYLAKSTRRILLIIDGKHWSVPTFARDKSLLQDAEQIVSTYSNGRILPIELYISNDKGFEYGTYICLVEEEFLTTSAATIAWASMNALPKSIHIGLKNTLLNPIIQTKIETILELSNEFDIEQ